MTDLHFSPRPNRAAEIDWQPWTPETFARAKILDKPILLSISAVWCHWCHVMDETSYSDDAVIATIREKYVAIRVDNDERPDVNARYNMGGWPTTAFLAPGGMTITGATYLPAQEMRRALDEIATFYAGNREQIAERAIELRDRRRGYTPASRSD
ncbi:MAG: thioredoxin domain-containing protein, partial [Candidatus Eremiobacteraeota bacterium]|nr:thioredoxin domain-containing protein [Candidatus Eremiobacteraeota bacterium]